MSQMKAQVDKLLTNVSQAYIPAGYISEALFPKLSVVQYSGLLGKYGKSHLRIERSIMGGRGKARRVEPIVRETQSYSVESHGLEGMVTKRDYANVEKPFDAERDETMGLTTMIWLEKEKVLGDVLANTAVLTQNTTLVGSDQYNDYAASDPIGDWVTARNAVRDGCGEFPNAAWMDEKVLNTLAYHPGVLQALGFTQARPGQLRPDELAKAMGVEKLLIAKPMYNTAKEGQSDALSPIWGKHVWFGVLPDKAMPYQRSLGYYITLASEGPRKVYKYDMDNPPGSKGIIVEDEYSHHIADVKCAYLIKNAIA